MKKVLILHNIISPIRVHLFNELNAYYQAQETSFKVVFLSVTDKNRDWKINMDMNFNYEILSNIPLRVGKKDLFTFFINPDILKIIKKENPTAIISFGWDNWATYIANWWCKKNNRKFILWAGSTAFEKSWRRTITRPLIKFLIKKTHHFIVYGTRAKKYLISLGAPGNSITIIYNSVDIDYFKNRSTQLSTHDKQNLKNKLNITTKKVIIFSGQLIERKGVFELLAGFKEYQKIDTDISLLIVGNGQEKEKMKNIIKMENIKNVIFAGFVQYCDLYKYYSISNLLIAPSREEVWGLVINEAMACGLPVITTNETGASVDLIQNGKNGYIIKSNCSNCIAKSIKNIFINNLDNKNNSWSTIQKTKIAKNITKLNSLTMM